MKRNQQQGFSLIELSIVLLILGIMIGGLMAMMTQDTRRTKQSDLKSKMDAIEQALGAFVKKNGRLPCPADGTSLIIAANFGKEATATTDVTTSCVGNATYVSGFRTVESSTPPSANAYLDTPDFIVAGVVPIKTLGLPDEAMFDPWGGRFSYTVDVRMTTTSNASTLTPYVAYGLTSTTVGSITVNGTSPTVLTDKALAIVLSHGPNGHGAYQLGNARKNAGSTNVDEQENCNCDDAAAEDVFDNDFTMHTATSDNDDLLDSFDDTLHYYTRGSFLSAADAISENKPD